jgi:hypothetical protein
MKALVISAPLLVTATPKGIEEAVVLATASPAVYGVALAGLVMVLDSLKIRFVWDIWFEEIMGLELV